MNRDDDSATLIFEGPAETFGFANFYKDPKSGTRVYIHELRWSDGFWQFPSRALSEGSKMVASTTETIAVADHRIYRVTSSRVVPESTVPTEPPLDISITFDDFGEVTTLGTDGTWVLEQLDYDADRGYWTVVFTDRHIREDGQPIVSTTQIPNHRIYHVDGHEF